jgi:putative ABC transport system permease protein
VRLEDDDVSDIRELVPGLDEVTISVNQSTSVFGGELEEETDATVVGAQANYRQVHNLSMLYGDFISDEDNAATSYIAVIGYGLAQEMFGYPAYAMGDYITIEEKKL